LRTVFVMKVRPEMPRERKAKRGVSKPVVLIENWAVVQSPIFRSYDELGPGKHLMGKVLGHANLPDMLLIYTSPIVSVDTNKGVIETLNTVYQLGKPSDDYKTWECARRETAAV
jgi:hypothetical protein